MGQIEIELFEYALMINHADGLTVVFPEFEHILMVEQNGKTTAISRGADLELRGPGGSALPPGKPQEVDYETYVVDIRWAEDDPQIPVPPALLDPGVAPDPSRLNGRLFLRGGTIIGQECTLATKRAPVIFKDRPHLVTDTARFQLAVPDGEVYELWVNGHRAMEIADGTSLRVTNSDAVGAPERLFHDLTEFVNMCKVLGHPASSAPAAGGAPFTSMGLRPVCAHAQISFP